MVLINGLLNLNPYRKRILREAARILKPGGALFGAELILKEPLPEELRSGEENWFS
jgi:arsenite methyltransferase